MHKALLVILFSISISASSQKDDKQNWGIWLSDQNRFKITTRIFYRDVISYRHLIKYDKWQRLSYNPAIVFNATNEIEDNIWNTGYRGRYRLNLKIPINKNAIADNTFYTGANAEIYTNFGNEIPEKYVDQMRFSATIEYRKNTKWTFDLLYVADRSKEIKEGYFELNLKM